VQEIMFADGHWIRAWGSEAVVDAADSDLYLAPAVRNAGRASRCSTAGTCGRSLCNPMSANSGVRCSALV
jgi:hypothetical protein